MAKVSRLAGSTSHILLIFIQDSSKSTGAGLTGLTYNSTGLTCYYKRNTGTASVAVTLANITTLGTYTSGGLREIDSANMPGVFEFHPPDAAYAAGAKSVVFMLQGATNMAPVLIEVELTATDNQDAQRYGMNALPATGTLAVNPTLNASQAFNNTGQTSNLPTDLQTIKGQVVTASAGVTFPASISSYAGGAVASVTAPVTVNTINGVAPPSNWNLMSVDASGRVLLQPSQSFNNTGQTTPLPSDLQAIKGQAVTAAAAVTFPATISSYAGGAVASVTAPVTLAATQSFNNTGQTSNLPANVTAIAGQAASAAAPVSFPAAIGTSTYAGGDTPGTTSLLATIGAAGAGLTSLGDARLANLDATVSSRLAASSYVAPDNSDIASIKATLGVAGAGLTALGDARLANLDVAVSSRLATTAYVAPDNADVAATLALLAGLVVSGDHTQLTAHALALAPVTVVPGTTTVGGYATGQDPATLLAAAGYTPARAAKLDNLDAAVSTRSTYAGGAVASVTAPVTVGTVQDKAGYSLAAAGLDAIAVEAGLNARQALALVASGDAGQVTYASGGTTVTITGAGVSTPRITATVDASGNRVPTIHPPA